MESFEQLLEEATSFHGHKCPGQVLGVRLAMLGCQKLGIQDPKAFRDLIVYVEIDRCATDAIQTVTGCKLGKRTLKHMDYGKMAATFLDISTGRAIRILARDDSRDMVWAYAPQGTSKKDAQVAAYKLMPEEELFVVTPVTVNVPEEDLPGHSRNRKTCSHCGEGINDHREIVRKGQVVCRACAYGAYYQTTISLPVASDATQD